MQLGINMYPGEKWCNPVIPHAKWHLQTSIALTDLTFLTDEMYRIFSTNPKSGKSQGKIKIVGIDFLIALLIES